MAIEDLRENRITATEFPAQPPKVLVVKDAWLGIHG
jgi:hypothetical protein